MYFFYYIPVGIDAGKRRFPVMTAFFSAVCVVVFVLNKYFAESLRLDFYAFIFYPGYSSPIASLTAAFLHFGYFHLIGNLVYLILFGSYLEDRLGSAVYSLVFILAAVGGNYAQAAYNEHLLGTNMGIIGASGSVSGVLGAFLIRLYRARVRIAYWVFAPLLAYTRAGRSYVPTIAAMAIWFLLQSVRSLLQFEGASANVAHVTHICGFLIGAAVAVATGGLARGRLEAHMVKARQYLHKGEFFGAQDELAAFVQRRPEDAEARAELARVLVQVGDRSAAQREYLMSCELYLKNGNRGRAEDIYAEIARSFPEAVLSSEVHLNMAFGLERNMKYEVALNAYLAFARRFPAHSEAPFTILRAANLQRNTFGLFEEAVQTYRRLIELYPNDAWADFAREQIRVLA